jgi:hypothetical protein
MLKSLWLTILGWFRTKADENTDLRYAGKEQFARNEQSIENVRKQRNSIAGSHLLLKKDIAEVTAKVDEATAAVKHWNTKGSQENEDKAYEIYKKEFARLKELTAEEKDLAGQIHTLDNLIEDLETDNRKAEKQISKAATTQQVGRATAAVESIHSELTNGALAGAIKTAEHMSATAEATKQARLAKDDSDVLNISESAALSKEDLLK